MNVLAGGGSGGGSSGGGGGWSTRESSDPPGAGVPSRSVSTSSTGSSRMGRMPGGGLREPPRDPTNPWGTKAGSEDGLGSPLSPSLAAFSAPAPTGGPGGTAPPGPLAENRTGFMFICSGDDEIEALGRKLFGLPKELFADMQQQITVPSTVRQVRGAGAPTLLFLYNIEKQLLSETSF